MPSTENLSEFFKPHKLQEIFAFCPTLNSYLSTEIFEKSAAFRLKQTFEVVKNVSFVSALANDWLKNLQTPDHHRAPEGSAT